MNSVMQGLLVVAANHDPRLTRVFSTYTASNPSVWLDIDREKAQALGLGMNDVFGALQATLGRHLYQQLQSVRPRLAGQHRGRGGRPQTTSRRCGRSIFATNTAPTCRCARSPMRASSSGRRSSPATTTTARSRYRAARRQGPRPAPHSRRMADVSGKTLPAGYGYEWTGTAYQEVAASGQTGAILGLAVLFAFLFLVGLYESWMIPVPVLLSVPGRGAWARFLAF